MTETTAIVEHESTTAVAAHGQRHRSTGSWYGTPHTCHIRDVRPTVAGLPKTFCGLKQPVALLGVLLPRASYAP
jgi:hypothetical protein